MIELSGDRYSAAASLVDRVPFNHLFASVVLGQQVHGRVLVDAGAPSVCLVVHKYGMALLCGKHDNESFNRELKGFLKNDTSNHGTARWLICHPNEWEATLGDLLGNDLVRLGGPNDERAIRAHREGKVLQTERVNFRFQGSPPASKPQPPPGFTLKRVDKELFDQIEGHVVPRCFWDSAEDFLRFGIGYSLLDRGRVVSTTFSSFVEEGKLELGVETAPTYRKRGLSFYPAFELIEYCLSRGFEPVWACERINIPSFKLALRLGFSPLSYHPYYAVPR